MSEEQAISSPELSAIPPKIEKSRRRLFQVIRTALVGGLWAVSMGLGTPINSGLRHVDHIVQSAENPSIQPDGASGSPPLEGSLLPENTLSMGEMRVFLDPQGMPVAYREGDGELQEFTQEEKIEMQYARTRALEMRELQVAFQHIRLNETFVRPSTPEQPWVTEVPEDLLSADELGAKGIRIINPPDPLAPKLHFRSSIFSGNNMLEPFDVLNANLPEEGKLRITFVVVNAEVLEATYALSPEYEAVRQYLKVFRFKYNKLIEEKVMELQQRIDESKHQLETEPDLEKRSVLDEAIVRWRTQQYYYLHTMSPAELFAEAVARHSQMIGQFVYLSEDKGEDGVRHLRDTYIFVALPDHTQTTSRTLTSLYFDERGGAQLSELTLGGESGASSPNIDESFPKPEKHLNTGFGTFENKYYKYDPATPGFVLRHEIAHLLLMEVIPELSKLGLLEQSQLVEHILQNASVKEWIDQYGMQDGEISPIPSEYITDVIAMLTLQFAEHKKHISGDESEYPFAIEIPENPVHPAGWHITNQMHERLEQLRKHEEAI